MYLFPFLPQLYISHSNLIPVAQSIKALQHIYTNVPAKPQLQALPHAKWKKTKGRPCHITLNITHMSSNK